MSTMDSLLIGSNVYYLVELLNRWQENPSDVEPEWQEFFTSLGEDEQATLAELQGAPWKPQLNRVILGDAAQDAALADIAVADTTKSTTAPDKQAILDTIRALMLIRTWRVRGHLNANLDPLNLHHHKELFSELQPSHFGFTDQDWDRQIFIDFYLGKEYATLTEIMAILKETYAGDIGVEFMHIIDPEIKNWVQTQVENSDYRKLFSKKERVVIHHNLAKAEALEQILAKRFVGTKRFGLDGGESTICSIEEMLNVLAGKGVEKAVVGMAHRGRLNILVNVLKKPFRAIVSEFEGNPSKPDDVQGSGDVKYHLGATALRKYQDNEITVSLEANPSHLEAVNPVVLGKVRAKQDALGDTERKKVVGLLIHGDAAFAGQGIVAEGLMMSDLKGYTTGGTIHLIINNQIGFTTLPLYSRSSPYCSDVAKMIQCPIFHVNGDNPEAVAYVSRMAADFQQTFGRDVVVDLFCYRRFGHNEGDEPRFTQPIMYKAVENHPTTYALHVQKLIDDGVFSADDAVQIRQKTDEQFEKEYTAGKDYRPANADWFKERWEGLLAPSSDSREEEHIDVMTCVDKETLTELGLKICALPKDIDLNPKVKRVLDARRTMIADGKNIDWAMGEALAFASLLHENVSVRLSGEDSGRGTFSHRHAVLVDQQTEARYLPLTQVNPNAHFEVWDSPLSEYGVLGYEYGYASAEPWKLVLWEAQFGDFANGAQIMIDQFISGSESKWLRMNGLVMLLPHGYEGQGPEHSSARLERYLQLCAENNMQVINPTTPANYFHALRRQIKRNFRKPLIVMSPKSMLRNKLAVSTLDEFSNDQYFRRVIDDKSEQLVASKHVRRLILCSGKIYWDLVSARDKDGVNDVAIVRLEQLYPFPWVRIEEQFKRYPNAEIIWAQEEPANAGAWTFVLMRMKNLLSDMKQHTRDIRYIGRPGMASTAAGLASKHQEELANIIAWTFHTDYYDIPQPFQRIKQWKRI